MWNKIMPFEVTTNERQNMTDDQVHEAKQALLHTFPRYNKRFADPIKNGEPRFALFSFVEMPDKDLGAFLEDIKSELPTELKTRLERLKARKQVIRGVGKIRGAFHTVGEADARAEEIIRDIDSTNSIFTCMMGQPFPLVTEGFSEEVTEIDLQKETETAIAQNVREKRRKEQKEMEEIKKREEALKADVTKEPGDDLEEDYVTRRVKLAHLRYAISEHDKKKAECIEHEQKCVEWLKEQSELHPEFEHNYMKKYLDARKAAHIPDDQVPEGFMRYMNEPI